MNTAELIELEPLPVKSENVVHLPLGLLGFETIKKYVLLANSEEAPFRWLQVVNDPSLAFLIISPADAVPHYQPELSADDVEFLGLTDPADALVYNIVTLRADGRATVNLKGPVVLNRYTLKAKQVVITNAAEYSVQHPLVLAE
jgi:flagellar assembly factor FliW